MDFSKIIKNHLCGRKYAWLYQQFCTYNERYSYDGFYYKIKSNVWYFEDIMIISHILNINLNNVLSEYEKTLVII